MSIRVYYCPTIGDGLTPETAFRARLHDIRAAARLDGEYVATLPNQLLPSSFFLCICRMTDWSAVDADTTLKKIFDSADLPDTITDWASFKSFMQSKTVGDIPLARRQALNSRLQSLGFDTSAVTLATTWWQVVVGMVQQMGYAPNADFLKIL